MKSRKILGAVHLCLKGSRQKDGANSEYMFHNDAYFTSSDFQVVGSGHTSLYNWAGEKQGMTPAEPTAVEPAQSAQAEPETAPVTRWRTARGWARDLLISVLV